VQCLLQLITRACPASLLSTHPCSCPTPLQEGDLLVARIRQEMEALKQQHAAVVGELQAKLAWYAENQELVSENNDLIQQQAATIHKLERRLELAGAAPGAAKVQGGESCIVWI
jgi:hypothetical protein